MRANQKRIGIDFLLITPRFLSINERAVSKLKRVPYCTELNRDRARIIIAVIEEVETLP